MRTPRTRVLLLSSLALVACQAGRGRLVAPAEIVAAGGWTLVDGVPFERQRAENDCGIAAAVMVLRFWGEAVTPEEVTAAHPGADGRGLRAGELRDFIRSRGLDAFVVRGEPADLRSAVERRRPLIVGLARGHGDDAVGHYEVVIGYQRQQRRILTLDPAAGWRESTFDSFAAEWARAQQVAVVVFRRGATGRNPTGQHAHIFEQR